MAINNCSMGSEAPSGAVWTDGRKRCRVSAYEYAHICRYDMYVCMYIYIYIYICTMYMYVYIYIYIYTHHVYVCVYIYIYIGWVATCWLRRNIGCFTRDVHCSTGAYAALLYVSCLMSILWYWNVSCLISRMSCFIGCCNGESCHAVPCCAVPCRAVPCRVVSCHVLSTICCLLVFCCPLLSVVFRLLSVVCCLFWRVACGVWCVVRLVHCALCSCVVLV